MKCHQMLHQLKDIKQENPNVYIFFVISERDVTRHAIIRCVMKMTRFWKAVIQVVMNCVCVLTLRVLTLKKEKEKRTV